jgi:hypothetical protein
VSDAVKFVLDALKEKGLYMDHLSVKANNFSDEAYLVEARIIVKKASMIMETPYED